MKDHRRNSDFKPTDHFSYKLIEGMTGIEVVADDFIAGGYGDTFELNTPVTTMLQQCNW